MKVHLKLTATMLSVLMCVSMVMAPVSVIADETGSPAETQTVETTEKQETKETKAAPKETEKPAQEESEKQSHEETEKKETEPVSTEKQETKVSETEKKEPESTEKRETTESTDGNKPEETEEQKPSEIEETAPEENVPEETDHEVKTEKGPAVTARRKAKNEVSIKKTKDNTCLGTSKIAKPVEPSSKDSYWSGSYVYFGNYNGTPIKFRVLAPNTKAYGGSTLFLDSDEMLFWSRFDNTEPYSKHWADSDIRATLNGSFLNGFTNSENAAIITSAGDGGLTYDSFLTFMYSSPVSVNDKVFLLDASEVMNPAYGYSSDCGFEDTDGDGNWGTVSWEQHDVDNRKKGGAHDEWMLRSALKANQINAGCVCSSGELYLNNCYNANGVAPALNINQSSIIFSTAVHGNLNTVGTEYKLTLKDPNLSIALPSGKTATVSGTTVAIPYQLSGINESNVNRVSVLIEKKYGNVYAIAHYDALNVASVNSGIGTFTLPSGLSLEDWGKSYKVYILAEQTFGSQTTDYASEPVIVNKPEQDPKVNLSNVSITIDAPVVGAKPDYTAVFPSGANYYSDAYNDENFRNDSYWYDIGIGKYVNPDSGVFEDGHAYRVAVYLTAKDGYTFTDSTTATVNGELAETLMTSGHQLNVTYTFASLNTLNVKPKTAKVKYKKLRKKNQTVVRSKVMTVSNAQGNVTYQLAGVKRGKSKKYKKYFKINATTGNVTVKKKLKKGTYKVTCKVTAAGDSNCSKGTKTVTFTIKVK